MTPEIAIVLAILVAAIIMFVTERIRVDVVALMVLVSLALTGLITPTEALSGFANLAVVTVWAVLILSAGLARTGVAGLIGRPAHRSSSLALVNTPGLCRAPGAGVFVEDIYARDANYFATNHQKSLNQPGCA